MSTPSCEPWEGLALPITAPGTWISAEASALLVRLIDGYARRELHLHPRQLPAHVAAIRAALITGSTGTSERDCGPADVRRSADLPLSDTSSNDWITTTEAAELMGGLSREHVGRLARSGALGTSRIIRGRRLVQRRQVEAYTIERSTT